MKKLIGLDDELMTIQEVVDFFKINRSTLYEWRHRGYLKAYGIGGRVYFKADEVKLAVTLLISKNEN